jgi:hypothetical protein
MIPSEERDDSLSLRNSNILLIYSIYRTLSSKVLFFESLKELTYPLWGAFDWYLPWNIDGYTRNFKQHLSETLQFLGSINDTRFRIQTEISGDIIFECCFICLLFSV